MPTFTLAAGIALALPSGAKAEEGADTGVTTLDKIDVQGTPGYKADKSASDKFTQSLLDTPQTLQIITSDLFDQQGATTLTEALRNSAGVGTFNAGENGSTNTGDAIYMRGFDTSNSIFVDGIRDTGSISRDIFNIDQIEVEKGPAGTDTGRSAPTGSIDMITKQANLHDATSGMVVAGVDGQKRSTVDWNRALGGGAAVRLDAMWQDSDVPGRDHLNNRRWGLAPSFAFGLEGATRAYLNLLYVKQNNVPDSLVPTIGLPTWLPQPGLAQLAGHPVAPSNFYGTRADHDDSNSKMATLRLVHEFSDTVVLSNIARWGRTEQDYLLTSYLGTGGTAANPNAGNIQWTNIDDLSTYTIGRSSPLFKDQNNAILTDQLNLRADFATGAVAHFLTAGLEYAREEQNNYGQAATNGSAWTRANLYAPDWNATGLTWAHNGANGHGKTDTASAFVFDTFKFGERFLLTAGVRLDHYTTDYDSTVLCGGRGAPVCGSLPTGTVVPGVNASASGTLLDWKLGAVYKIGPSASLYANAALSQQPPGGANFTLSSANTSADNPNLDPQKARTFETGLKWDVLAEALSLDAALFQTTVDNMINTQVLDDAGNPTQTGKQRVKGVELSAVGKISENWSVTAGFTRLSTKVVAGALTAQDGTPNLTYTPDKAFTAWTTYRLPFGLTVGGGVRYTGGLHKGSDPAFGTPDFTVPWTVYDLLLSYAIDEHLGLRLNGYNLTDKFYVASINKSGYRYTPGTPRTFLLSADFKF